MCKFEALNPGIKIFLLWHEDTEIFTTLSLKIQGRTDKNFLKYFNVV